MRVLAVKKRLDKVWKEVRILGKYFFMRVLGKKLIYSESWGFRICFDENFGDVIILGSKG